ncbi:macrophage mannose receptor 1-like [Seriola lalandi dorsalis]|uniref:Macrophage mannose receptor 1-like n=1 Tax=Seriola lalandi dorsalis TaxID=1841481 RepID=A0A3B4XQU1_SERLL|nr:macrophage mannose receptor 1-like [Seriola lalandi dorsalis]
MVKRFHLVVKFLSWHQARSYCRQHYKDLATILDSASNAEVSDIAKMGTYWIGLHQSNWRWSQVEYVVQMNTLWNNSWDEGEPRDGKCVAISGQGRWAVRDCEDQHPFSCYSAAANRHILQSHSMTWSEAQSYCRSKYTDLSSIRIQEDNDEISSLLQSITDSVNGTVNGTMAWIGLQRYVWMWSDGSDASYMPWGPGMPVGLTYCVTTKTYKLPTTWYSQSCHKASAFVCYTEVRQSVLRSVKVRLSRGSADLDDPTLQDSIQQQLQQKLEERGMTKEVKLRWKTQPDGKVFHREEEEGGHCEEGNVCVTV